MPVSADERRQVLKINRAVARIQRLGVRASLVFAARMQSRLIRGFRRGENLTTLLREAFETQVDALTGGMVTAHLTGASINQRIPTKGFGFALGPYKRSVEVLRQRAAMTAEQIATIESTYQAEAIRVVSGASRLAEQTIEKALVEIRAQGLAGRAATGRLQAAFQSAGISPRNSFTIENLYRTQTQLAMSAGRLNLNAEPAIDEILWGYTYVTAGDERVRPEHEALDGATLPKDHPFWQQNFPPNGWSCRCQAIEVFEPREEVLPPETTTDHRGRPVPTGAARGFDFNPGTVFNPAVAAA